MKMSKRDRSNFVRAIFAVNGYMVGGGCDGVKLDVRCRCGKCMLIPDVTVNDVLQSQDKNTLPGLMM